MLLKIIIFLGVVVVLQLWVINQSLQSLKEKLLVLEGIANKITEEFQGYKNFTFPRDLRNCLKEIPNDVVEELNWGKGYSFAACLRGWLQEIAENTKRPGR
ncbi:MAG: hypothetical protein WAM66_03445 [Acidobacteriaceae bacterium]